jgi:hypothetical protein
MRIRAVCILWVCVFQLSWRRWCCFQRILALQCFRFSFALYLTRLVGAPAVSIKNFQGILEIIGRYPAESQSMECKRYIQKHCLLGAGKDDEEAVSRISNFIVLEQCTNAMPRLGLHDDYSSTVHC